MFGLSFFELAMIGIIAVVLFGGNLPEVAKKFGAVYGNLRRSVDEVQQQFRQAEYDVSNSMSMDDDQADLEDEPAEPSAPKFTPPE